MRAWHDSIGGPLVSTLLLAGCQTPLQTYAGPGLPPSDVAVLSVPGSASIQQIDGQPVRTRALELLPGSHVAQVRFQEIPDEVHGGLRDYRIYALCEIDFVAERGHTYRLERTLTPSVEVSRAVHERVSSFELHAHIADETTESVLESAKTACRAD